MPDHPAAYDVAFEWDESHGRLASLLAARPGRGIVIDLGCGYAPHAEPLRDAGFAYVGFDINETAVTALSERGFEAHLVDLGDRRGTLDALADVVHASDKRLVAVLALDVIEHLVSPHLLLDELSKFLRRHDGAVLGVSVPNVGYVDLGLKLLAGRWDVTPTGLLDHTHLRFFTDRSLDELMDSAAFAEVARDDRPAARSDQFWPSGSPFLAGAARLSDMLRHVRSLADEHASTYQFIRLYEPTGKRSMPTILRRPFEAPATFLSVIADPAMTDDEIDRLRSMLDAQTSSGWELLRAPEGDSEFRRDEMFSALFAAATGAYLSVVGPGDQLAPNWVEQFVDAGFDEHDQLVGPILRCRAGDGVELVVAHPGVAELGMLDASSATFALPIDAVRSLGLGVGDDALPPSVSLLLDAVQFCGVVETEVMALGEWTRVDVDPVDVAARIARIDERPVLLPPGTLRRLADLENARRVAERRIVDLVDDRALLRRDNAWLNEELGAAPVRAVRKALRRPPSGR